jgi:hypothetical protein
VVEGWVGQAQCRVRAGSTFPQDALIKATTQSFHRFHLRVSTLYKRKVQHGVIRVCLPHLPYKPLSSQLLSINKTSTFSLTSQPDSSLIINNNFNHSSTINNQPTAIMSTDFGRKVCLLIHHSIMHITDIHPGSV